MGDVNVIKDGLDITAKKVFFSRYCLAINLVLELCLSSINPVTKSFLIDIILKQG